MKEWEYSHLQNRLSKKLKDNPYSRTGCSKYETGYKEGILAAKSILSDFHKSQEGKSSCS